MSHFRTGFIVLWIFLAGRLAAQVPSLLNYQGRLLNGTNLVNGSVALSLRLYNASGGGTLLYEDSNTVTAVDGLYATQLGDHTTSGSLTEALTNAQVWIEVAVGGVALSPRERLAAVGYALATRGVLIDSSTNVVMLPDVNAAATSLYGHAVIGGGERNEIQASSGNSVIGGGYFNVIRSNANYSTIAGGSGHNVSNGANHATIGGGSGNSVGAPYGTVPGGGQNVAGGSYSFAAGFQARALHPGAFVWADWQGTPFATTASNQFLIRASGGVGIGTTNTSAALLNVAGDVFVTGAITAASLSGNGATISNIGGASLVAGSVSNVHLALNAVTSSRVADGSLVDGDINVDAAILATKIANTALVQNTAFGGVVTGAYNNLGLTPGGVTGDKIALGTISNAHLALGTIKADRVASGTFVRITGDTMTGALTNEQGVTAPRFASSYNNVAGTNSAAPGGSNNNISISSGHAVIGGGFANTILGVSADYSAIGGGNGNLIGQGDRGATVAGGEDNRIGSASPFGSVGGGLGHRIGTNAAYAVIGGGGTNSIGAGSRGALIAGGSSNRIGTLSLHATIAGGEDGSIGNASAQAVIGGGAGNTISNDCSHSVVAGGQDNMLGNSVQYSAIAGGQINRIVFNTWYATIAGGHDNEIGETADSSFIAGGYRNGVSNSAQYAFVGGRSAKALHPGTFVWGDSSTNEVASTTRDQVTFRCQGGVRFLNTNGVLSASWAPGALAWTFVSDRAAKERIEPVDTAAVLDKVLALPIAEWNYTGYPQRHIGPMAQDFHAAFPLNENDKAIDSGDLPGVALAAIQALAAEGRNRQEQIDQLRAENAALKARLERLEAAAPRCSQRDTP